MTGLIDFGNSPHLWKLLSPPFENWLSPPFENAFHQSFQSPTAIWNSMQLVDSRDIKPKRFHMDPTLISNQSAFIDPNLGFWKSNLIWGWKNYTLFNAIDATGNTWRHIKEVKLENRLNWYLPNLSPSSQDWKEWISEGLAYDIKWGPFQLWWECSRGLKRPLQLGAHTSLWTFLHNYTKKSDRILKAQIFQ